MKDTELVEKVCAKRRDGQTWASFAARLRCSASELQKLRIGKRQVPLWFIRRSLKLWPDLRKDVVEYLGLEGEDA